MRYFLYQLKIFIYKQANAALFGAIMLIFLLLSKYIFIPGLYRYDLLFILAILVQIILIITKLEAKKEVLVILVFHISAMIMELYKTSSFVGSWSYPEQAFFAVGTVPLFTGFMYSSVGSYIARAWKINKFRFVKLPTRINLIFLGLLIYINFFTNHFMFDFRYLLLVLLIIAFWKTKFYVQLTDRVFQIHPLIANFLLALFVWFAEQIGTFARAWVYPHQLNSWSPVSLHMLSSWYMLLVFSFVIISSIYRDSKDNM